MRFFALFCALAHVVDSTSWKPIVIPSPLGPIRGLQSATVRSFRGINYAKASARFAPSAEIKPWGPSTTYDATK